MGSWFRIVFPGQTAEIREMSARNQHNRLLHVGKLPSVFESLKCRNIPVIRPGLVQLREGVWVGLEMGGLISLGGGGV